MLHRFQVTSFEYHNVLTRMVHFNETISNVRPSGWIETHARTYTRDIEGKLWILAFTTLSVPMSVIELKRKSYLEGHVSQRMKDL